MFLVGGAPFGGFATLSLVFLPEFLPDFIRRAGSARPLEELFLALFGAEREKFTRPTCGPSMLPPQSGEPAFHLRSRPGRTEEHRALLDSKRVARPRRLVFLRDAHNPVLTAIIFVVTRGSTEIPLKCGVCEHPPRELQTDMEARI